MDRHVTVEQRSMKPIYYNGRTAKEISKYCNIQIIISLNLNLMHNVTDVFSRRDSGGLHREMAAETIFSAVSSLFSGYLWKYSNTIIGSVTMETATHPGSLSSDSEYFLTLSDGENGEGMKSQTPSASPPERCRRCLGACVCYGDYGLYFICISDQKQISPSKRNYQAVDHIDNLHIWSTSEKQFPSN